MWYLIMVFICISLRNMMLTISLYTCCPFNYFLGRNVCSDPFCFSVGFFLLLLSCKSFLYILDTRSLSRQLVSSVVSNSLQPHELQHARLPCPSLTPGACSNLCPSSQWCHPTILSSFIPFSSHLQSFPALRSHQVMIFRYLVVFTLDYVIQSTLSVFLLLVILVSYIRNYCQIQGHVCFWDFYSLGSYIPNLETILS